MNSAAIETEFSVGSRIVRKIGKGFAHGAVEKDAGGGYHRYFCRFDDGTIAWCHPFWMRLEVQE